MTDTGSTNRVFGNRYEIKHKIARGGMADVFYAQDTLLDRPVALKVLFPELSVDPSFVERFRREAQSAARLSHPNIVSVYDWGEDASTYYIVMELVEGKSLSAMLREQGRIPVDRAAAIGAEVAAALNFAHKNGVIHRDVKPGNVLIDGRGSVKVTDFGIARARNTTENLTQTGAVMGTATYFSPEQAQGLSVDPRSDVYSLGVVLYEMVVGKPPFAGDNPVTIAYKHVRETPEPLRAIDPSIPADFQAIVGQALTKSPANRYASAEELRADLERFRRGQPVSATGIISSSDATQINPVAAGYRSPQQAYADSTRTIPSAAPTQRPAPRPEPKRSVAGPLALFGALLAAIIIGVIVFLNSGFGNSNSGPVQVPSVVDQTLSDAREELEDLGLNVDSRTVANDKPSGIVIAQDPAAGATVERNHRVSLTVSAGPAPVTVPNVVGRSEADAQKALEAAGLRVTKTRTTDDTVASGNVIRQDPSSGEAVEKGDSVAITISTGRPKVEVPNLEGFTRSAAERTLSDSKLSSRVITEASNQPEGSVLRTQPDAGSSVEQGSTVTIVVSSGAATTTTSLTTTTTEAD